LPFLHWLRKNLPMRSRRGGLAIGLLALLLTTGTATQEGVGHLLFDMKEARGMVGGNGKSAWPGGGLGL
jgi:hypothetical protein